MATDYGGLAVWGVIVAIGAATFAIRWSFIGLFGRLDEIPPGLERALRFVPAAVLAAIVAPALVTTAPETGGLAVDKLVAGAAAGAIAWRTGNVFATMAGGMGVLWAVRFLP